ncbi:MAG: hypothetical protein EB066_08100, partial [Betaproteobacteria bacterium]|nr:hypothetical protein [Betaproteobacteria bacterium]
MIFGSQPLLSLADVYPANEEDMTTQPPFTGSDAQVNSSAIEEMFAGKSVACPCCNGTLTPSMLQKIMDDASRLEG